MPRGIVVSIPQSCLVTLVAVGVVLFERVCCCSNTCVAAAAAAATTTTTTTIASHRGIELIRFDQLLSYGNPAL